MFLNKVICFLSLLVFSASPLYTAGGHRGNITALLHKGNTVISAGEDGFIVIWDVNQRTAASRFQLTTGRIQSIVSHPQNDEICIIESGGLNSYRISAWNYVLKRKLFSVFSAQPVGFINYSGGGNYIIASGLNGGALSLLDSVTGQLVSPAEIPAGNVSFAMTGRSERNMLIYQSEHDEYSARAGYSGRILYYDIDSRTVTGSFQAPGNLSNPVVFGNNRFLAGINSDGLLLVDAASGETFDTVANIERNTLVCLSGDGFYSLRQRGTSATLNRYSVDRNARLVSSQQLSLSLGSAGSVSAVAYNGSLVFASSQGSILFLDRQNRLAASTQQFQTRVTEIAATDRNIAFLTENGEFSFIPLDFRLIQRTSVFTMAQKRGYSRLTPVPAAGEDRFILWQTENTRDVPQFLDINQRINQRDLAFLRGRFPLLSISVLNNRLLALDSGGNITIWNTENLSSPNASSRADFTFSSIGAIDSTLINNDYFVVSRSAINNNSPYIFVNIRTSETVPVSHPAQAGLTVFSGSHGNVYAEAVERDNNGIKTTVVSLPPVSSLGTRTGSAVRIFEYMGEASYLSIAESGGNIAVACGSEGAVIFADNLIYMERTSGLPFKLLGDDNFFLSLDSEGNIAWHDNKTGGLLAVFSLNGNRWTLSSGNREITGDFSRP
jgi:WD40 repeat protein